MKIRYLYLTALLTVALFFTWSCEKEYMAPTGDPNHEFVTSGAGDQAIVMQVNSTMDFIDLSRGVVDRTWTFPAGIVDIIDSDNDVTSKLDVVKATFYQHGIFQVNLSQTYAGNVYIDTLKSASNKYDTILTVTVLDSVRANFEARRVTDNSVLENRNGAKNQVMAGREVLLVHRSTGQPENNIWIIENDKGFQRTIEGDSVVTVFSSLGLYSITLLSSNAFGSDTISYTDWLESIPSTDPVELYNVTSDAGKIMLEYSRDVADPSSCPLEAFNLDVYNGANSYDINVSRLSLDPLQNNILVLDLDADIYNSDKIYISYDSTVGNLETADEMAMPSILPEDSVQVVFIAPNILIGTSYDYSFENYDESIWRSANWGIRIFSESYLEGMSETIFQDGKRSAKFNVIADSGSTTVQYEAEAPNEDQVSFELNSGTEYLVSFWVYVEDLGDRNPSVTVPDVRLFIVKENGVEDAIVAGNGKGDFVEFEPDFPAGTWVRHSYRYRCTEKDDYRFLIRGWNENNTQNLIFYMDNLSLSVLQPRP